MEYIISLAVSDGSGLQTESRSKGSDAFNDRFRKSGGWPMKKGQMFFALAACLIVATGCGKQDQDADKDKDKAATQSQVTLARDDIEQLGIQTASVQATTYVPDVRGYGAVVSFDTLAQSVADLASAEAAVRQSRTALEHDTELAADRLITRGQLEVARRQVTTDTSQLLLAERKQAVDFGRNAPWRAPGGSSIIEQLSSGRLVLVRVTFPAGSGETSPTLTIERVGHSGGQ
jgi:hypothetical protein